MDQRETSPIVDGTSLVAPVGGSAREDAVVFVRGLLDARLRDWLTRGMLSAIYRVGAVLALIPPIFFTVLAFQNLAWGLAWLLVLGPALFIALVTALRLVLGFALVFLTLMEQLLELPAAVDRLTAQVDGLRADVGALPGAVEDLTGTAAGLTSHVDSLKDSLDRVQFWRAGRLRRTARRAAESDQPSDLRTPEQR